MKTIALLLVAFAGLPAVPDGAEIEAPVQEVMDATVQNWASESRFDLIDGIRTGQSCGMGLAVSALQSYSPHDSKDGIYGGHE
ncbi:hypothetical protein [Rhizobium sullae]|uniref:hypothetical protein n=1 Tax=Rhizobium sullae TaxID=50338 RepID=UPI00117B303F|nr:hypothetical protein [Rhizobium sullae]